MVTNVPSINTQTKREREREREKTLHPEPWTLNHVYYYTFWVTATTTPIQQNLALYNYVSVTNTILLENFRHIMKLSPYHGSMLLRPIPQFVFWMFIFKAPGSSHKIACLVMSGFELANSEIVVPRRRFQKFWKGRDDCNLKVLFPPPKIMVNHFFNPAWNGSNSLSPSRSLDEIV